jgi:hypothetical protein
MFDDQLPTSQGVPPNLPLGEPEDMFDTIDPAPQEEGVLDSSTNIIQEGKMAEQVSNQMIPTVSSGSSAVSAGKLQPKDPIMTGSASFEQDPMLQDHITTMPVELSPDIPRSSTTEPITSTAFTGGSMAVDDMKSPNIVKTITLIVVIVFVGVIVIGGGWFVFTQVARNNTNPTPVPMIDVVDMPMFDDNPLVEDIIIQEEDTFDSVISPDDAPPTIPLPTANTVTPADIMDNRILFGDDLDTDEDGLPDWYEIEIGTDPFNWDTDGDGLSDGDEVLIWGTDPLNPDTDGDGFSDGDEVAAGYSPLVGGGARLFETTPPPVVNNGNSNNSL